MSERDSAAKDDIDEAAVHSSASDENDDGDIASLDVPPDASSSLFGDTDAWRSSTPDGNNSDIESQQVSSADADEMQARGVEHIDDSGPTLTLPGAVSASFDDPSSKRTANKTMGRVEHVDADGPADPGAVADSFEDFGAVANKMKLKARGHVEQVDADGPASPSFMQSEFGDNMKKKAADPGPSANVQTFLQTSPRLGDSITTPNDAEDEPHPSKRTPADIQSRNGNDDDGAARVDRVHTADPLPAHGLRGDESLPKIPVAFLVEESDREEEIIISGHAEPLPPWWKQRRTICLFAAFVVISAVAVGVSIAMSRKATTTIVGTSSPTVSLAPTGKPSPYPSTSLVPSSMPSSCSYKITRNKQLVDPIHPESIDQRIAVDGEDMVVVSMDYSESDILGSPIGSLYVVFYLLTEDDEWEKDALFTEGNILWKAGLSGGSTYYTVALSSSTAIVGVPSKDAVLIFEKNRFGIWAKVNSPAYSSVTPTICEGAGTSVGISGDLMVFTDTGTCAYSTNPLRAIEVSPNAAYVFKRVAGNWRHLRTFQGEDQWDEFYGCFVERNLIALLERGRTMLYIYVRETDSIELLQDFPYAVKAVNGDGIVHSNSSGIFLYQRESDQEEFTFSQVLSSDADVGNQIAMDRGVLVVGGSNQTNIFIQEEGNWKVELTLNESYSNYHISGINLIANKQKEVHAMSIEDCVEQVPVPTQLPSASIAPTVCYRIDLALLDFPDGDDDMIQYHPQIDDLSVGVPWGIKIQKNEGVIVTVGSWSGNKGGNFGGGGFEESICLQPGQYKISIRLESSTGLYYPIGAHFIVKSNGHSIVKQTFFDQVQETYMVTLPLASLSPSEPAIPEPTHSPSQYSTPKPTTSTFP